MTRYILPVNLDVDMNINCFDYYKLSMILSNKELIPWYIERFIGLQVDQYFECSYYELGSSSPTEYEFVFDEVLSTTRIILGKDTILDATLKALKEKKYVLLTLNQKYFREYHKVRNLDSVHGTMFVGYDEETELLYFLENVDNKWSLESLNFSDLEQSFHSSLEIILKDDYVDSWLLFLSRVGEPASTFEVKNNFNRQVRLNIIYDTLIHYLNGVENISRDSRFYRWNGIAIYKAFYQNLTEILLNNDLHEYFKPFRIHNIEKGMRRLLENKRGLIYRANYLVESLRIECDETLVKDLRDLYSLLETGVALYSKFFRKQDKKIIERANVNLKRAEELECIILSKLSNSILNHIKLNIGH
ncbi:hypothetical protein NSQ90_08765 [Paenibacillus sp. FSL H7-0737]|uniref:hypothetical protein n=1 Tax=Paenibacillus sp. FSL H7-0737 TaxID=1536775 RepID=UPI0004F6AD1C|nr:hypothetical protein [Paenibacillus sp. FSL H7-0737]AIQ22957.1 hypothetical protein H70737_08880 [Paenibacillus sp. FSL H7-0737]